MKPITKILFRNYLYVVTMTVAIILSVLFKIRHDSFMFWLSFILYSVAFIGQFYYIATLAKKITKLKEDLFVLSIQNKVIGDELLEVTK